ncbi:MAG: 30S ribosomal protein S9 [Spirochaetia bacterium]|nr:30S ribosomal protein S9 [Spirochaetia bacterium]
MAVKTRIIVGRRKTAVARAKVTPGTGKYLVNGKEMKVFFPVPRLQVTVTQPLKVTGLEEKYDVAARVVGGGITGQAGAVRLSVARALQIINPDLHTDLKKAGFLRRDPRMVERKKYGKRKARRGTQFSKR